MAVLRMALVWLLCLGTGAAAQVFAPGEERRYDEVGGWTLVSGFEAGALGYCAAGRKATDRRARIIHTGDGWLLALDLVPPQRPLEAPMNVDGIPYQLSGEVAGGWSYLTLNARTRKALQAGQLAVVRLGRETVEVPLPGSHAAVIALEECWQRGGEPPPPDPDALPLREPELPLLPGLDSLLGGGGFGDPCPPLAMIASQRGGQQVQVAFVYGRPADGMRLQIFWVDPYARMRIVGALGPDLRRLLVTAQVGDSFIARDDFGNCYGGEMRVRPGKSVFTVG
jgi:hypothetical protein